MVDHKLNEINMQSPIRLNINTSDFWLMFMSTIRYSMGRRTYMPGVCVDLYKKYNYVLDGDQREHIRREIKKELEDATKEGQLLGDKINHQIWENLVEMIDADEEG